MPGIRHVLIVLGLLLSAAVSSAAQLSVGIGFPQLSIGINLSAYPNLVRVPGYPVYYAPGLEANFFFYDSMYWVYQDDSWYASSWYNGPWGIVDPEFVPEFVLRVPVRYYRQPPVYFRGWRSDAPPRWGDHWGRGWEQSRRGWDHWNRKAAPAPAPLPAYQRRYTGDRYPHQVEQQQELQQRSYRYQPRDPVVRQHYQERQGENAPVRMEQRPPDAHPPMQYRQDGATLPHSPSRGNEDDGVMRFGPGSTQPVRPTVQDRDRGVETTHGRQENTQRGRAAGPEDGVSRQRDAPRLAPPETGPVPREQQMGGENAHRPAPAGPQPARPDIRNQGQVAHPEPMLRKPDMSVSPEREGRAQGRDANSEPSRGQEREHGQGRGRD